MCPVVKVKCCGRSSNCLAKMVAAAPFKLGCPAGYSGCAGVLMSGSHSGSDSVSAFASLFAKGLLSIPGPVLPELVEANIVFALLRLGRREEALVHLQGALRKHPNDMTGNLAAIEALFAADSDPQEGDRVDRDGRATQGGQSRASRGVSPCVRMRTHGPRRRSRSLAARRG